MYAMPNFHFVVRDRQGSQRSGRINSASLEEARRRIEATGLTILQLTDHESTVVAQSPKRDSFRARRAAPLEIRASYLEQGLEFIDEVSQPERFQRFLWVMALVGLIISFFWFTRPLKPNPKVLPPPQLVPLRLTVEGSVRCEADLSQVQVTLEFPELDYRLQRSWNQMQHAGPDAYSLKLDTKVTRLPTRLIVRAERNGYLPVESASIPWTDGTVQVPAFTFRKDERPQPTPAAVNRPQVTNVPPRPPVPAKPRPRV